MVKSVIIQDVWVIPVGQFDKLNQEVEDILKKLQGTSFLDRGQIMADAIQRRLRELSTHQGTPFVNPEAHISRYRDDLKVLQSIEADLVSLRQLMVMAALEPSARVAIGGQETQAGSAEGAGQERGGLSILTTWHIIFIVLGLLVLVSLSFFLIWQRQLKLQLAKEAANATREQRATSGDDLLTSGNGGTPPVAPSVQPKSP